MITPRWYNFDMRYTPAAISPTRKNVDTRMQTVNNIRAQFCIESLSNDTIIPYFLALLCHFCSFRLQFFQFCHDRFLALGFPTSIIWYNVLRGRSVFLHIYICKNAHLDTLPVYFLHRYIFIYPHKTTGVDACNIFTRGVRPCSCSSPKRKDSIYCHGHIIQTSHKKH